MFTGDKAIFKGFKKDERKGYGLTYRSKTHSVTFRLMGWVQVFLNVEDDLYDQLGDCNTLATLSELTKDNPIELC